MKKIICIDPGHGGKDPGGGSNDKFLEKNMVLDMSKEQKKHFERNGIKVVMTRTADEYLDSVPRTNRVKASGAKYCISNHINSFNGKAEGAETIHSIYANHKIASGVLDSLVRAGARYRRVFSKQGSNGDWYYMMRMTGSVQTIIIEYGFADNESDTRKIIKDWKRYAEAVAKYYIEHVFQQKYVGISAENKTNHPSPQTTKVSYIQTIQSTLNLRYGFGHAVDGYCGPNTKQAIIRAYQIELNKQFNARLVTDGIWGPKTRKSTVTIKHGAKGNITWLIQARLYCLGYDPNGLDGVFGSGLLKAVKQFQVSQNIRNDGLVGQVTFSKLLG